MVRGSQQLLHDIVSEDRTARVAELLLMSKRHFVSSNATAGRLSLSANKFLKSAHWTKPAKRSTGNLTNWAKRKEV